MTSQFIWTCALSEGYKRAKVIFDYLVEAGFDSTKLSYKGMGNTSPRNTNTATSDEARANMRVEICIYRIFSGK